MRRKILRCYVTAEPLAVLPPVLSLRIFKRARISAKLRFNAKFIHLPRFAADEILPLAARRARYLLAVLARHRPHILAASRHFTNANICRLSPASSRIFLRLVTCASPHLRQDRAVPLKHANLSCIKFRFFAVLASCRSLSCLSVASRRRAISFARARRTLCKF